MRLVVDESCGVDKQSTHRSISCEQNHYDFTTSSHGFLDYTCGIRANPPHREDTVLSSPAT